MPRSVGSVKNWCFTHNNYDTAEHGRCLALLEGQCSYWIVGKEVGDGGTPHLQGYAIFRQRVDLNALRRIFGPRYHFERARGNPGQNRVYCSKGGDFREGGEFPERGTKAKGRDQIATEFKSAYGGGNSGLAEFADANPGAWYYSGYSLLRNAQLLVQPVHRPNITVRWIWGPPGSGKSRFAHEELPEAYVKEPRTKWWNGYLHEKQVIIDDFGPNGIDLNHLLRWFDRYKCLVESKGGMLSLHAETFIVTSNFHPSECWKDKDGVIHPQMDALYRRIEIINKE